MTNLRIGDTDELKWLKTSLRDKGKKKYNLQPQNNDVIGGNKSIALMY
jgi:hypothetical protein